MRLTTNLAHNILPSLFMVLPIGMVISNRTSTAIVAIYAIIALSGIRERTDLLKVFYLPMSFLVCLSILSPWSLDPSVSIISAFKISGLIAMSLLIVTAMPSASSGLILKYSVTGLLIGLIIMVLAMSKIINLDAFNGIESFRALIYNRSVIVMAVISTTAMSILMSVQMALSARLKVGILGILTFVVLLLMDNQSAVLYLPAFVICLLFFNQFEALIGVSKWALICVILLAPLWASALSSLLPLQLGNPVIDQILIASNAEARIEIWSAFANATLEKPFIGWGLGTERYVHEFASDQSSQWLRQNHPHSLPLQIWVNLGVYGALLLSVGIYLLFFWISKKPRRIAELLAAQTVALFVVACVGHGAWQSWWLVVLPLPYVVAFLDPLSLEK